MKPSSEFDLREVAQIIVTDPSFWGVQGGRVPPPPPYNHKAEHLPQKHTLESTILHQFGIMRGHVPRLP